MVEWIPLLRRIQDAGKLIHAQCEKGEVETMLRNLKNEGLRRVTGCDSIEEARDLLRCVERWTNS